MSKSIYFVLDIQANIIAIFIYLFFFSFYMFFANQIFAVITIILANKNAFA